jgi:hypothetical protein
MDQGHGEENPQDHKPNLGREALPLTLWVRGDEDFATDFFLEADDVMQILGIKRSRLTQISGRELRVARRKMGRYVKPFYREADVLQYKSWTRATAAHAKSKNLVDQAIGELKQVAQSVQEGFADQRTAADSDLLMGQVMALSKQLQLLMRRSKGQDQLTQVQVSQVKGMLAGLYPKQQQSVEQMEDLKSVFKQLSRQIELTSASAAIQQQNIHELQLKVSELSLQLQETSSFVESRVAAMTEAIAKDAARANAWDLPKTDKGVLASLGFYKERTQSRLNVPKAAHKAWLRFSI